MALPIETFVDTVTADNQTWAKIKKGVDKVIRHEMLLTNAKEELSLGLKNAAKAPELRVEYQEALTGYGVSVKEVQNAHKVYATHLDETLKRAVDHQVEASKKMKTTATKLKKGGGKITDQFKEDAKNYEREKSRYYRLMLQHAISAEMSYHAAALQRLADAAAKVNDIDPERAVEAFETQFK